MDDEKLYVVIATRGGEDHDVVDEFGLNREEAIKYAARLLAITDRYDVWDNVWIFEQFTDSSLLEEAAARAEVLKREHLAAKAEADRKNRELQEARNNVYKLKQFDELKKELEAKGLL